MDEHNPLRDDISHSETRGSVSVSLSSSGWRVPAPQRMTTTDTTWSYRQEPRRKGSLINQKEKKKKRRGRHDQIHVRHIRIKWGRKAKGRSHLGEPPRGPPTSPGRSDRCIAGFLWLRSANFGLDQQALQVTLQSGYKIPYCDRPRPR